MSLCKIKTKPKELDSYFTPYTNSYSKWIIDLNVRTISILSLELNREGNICDLGFLREDTKNMNNKR